MIGCNLPASRLCDGPPSTSERAQAPSPQFPAFQTALTQSSRRNLSQSAWRRDLQICWAAAVEAPPKKAARIPPLPFVKVAGQEDMKLALLLNVVDPGIGGVLIMGDRGTGKSVCVSLLWNPTAFMVSLHYMQRCLSSGETH